ncbi:MAG: carboxymuconolactone decarboxylase family protein [Acidimicrobiaceae bacterium]|nr:carboxymuconolactone decarboxylase family protein [Acidimicrobiaceae bacterium]
MTPPRIAPVPVGDSDPDVRALLDPLGDRGDSNFFRTLVRNPRLFKRWVRYGHFLINGELPARDRELLVLRAAHRSDCGYEWTQHVQIASAAGLSADEIDRVRLGPDDGAWSAFDATLLRAADELIDHHTLTDRTWAALAERYDEPQMIEVPVVVGVFYSMGFTLNSFGVQAEPEVA